MPNVIIIHRYIILCIQIHNTSLLTSQKDYHPFSTLGNLTKITKERYSCYSFVFKKNIYEITYHSLLVVTCESITPSQLNFKHYGL